MAKRLYFDTGTPTISPTPDGSWEVTGSMVRRWLDIGKFEHHGFESLAVATALNSPAGAVDALILQAVSPMLSGAQTIAGAIKGQIRAFESNLAADLRMQCVIWVRQSNGSNRGTLIASNADALANEFSTSLRNIRIPKGGSTVPTSVNAQDGDRVVVEIGYRKHENATNSRTGTFDSGNSNQIGGDLPEDETTTSVLTGWIEFADTLVFQSVPIRATQVVAETFYTPNPAVRATQVIAETFYTPTPAVRASQVVMKVFLTDGGHTQVVWIGL